MAHKLYFSFLIILLALLGNRPLSAQAQLPLDVALGETEQYISGGDSAEAGDCVIPPSGPWPPCATGGTPPPASSGGDCIIPPSGPWPPCATGGATPPASGGDCVIPPSGPWPPCATGDAVPPASGGDCVIPPSGPWPPCATGGQPTPTFEQAVTCDEIYQISREQCAVLQDLFDADFGRKGPRTVAWFTSRTPCLWGRGNDLSQTLDIIICDFSSGRARITSLHLVTDGHTIPDSISNLRWLEIVTIETNRALRSLPDQFGMLPNLERLSLHQLFKVTSLPAALGNLSGLKSLRIDNLPRLTELPDTIYTLAMLDRLTLWNLPQLSSVSANIDAISRLERLTLSGLGVSQLPCTIGSLASLSSIQITGNPQLQTVPSSIGDLQQLRELNISNNASLSELPAPLARSNFSPSIQYFVDVPINVDVLDNCDA